MNSPSQLPWWTPFPAPVLWGVIVCWIPLSVPVMMGLTFGTAAFVGLQLLLDRDKSTEPA